MNTFYQPDLSSGIKHLPEGESRHCAQVLRHQVGDEIRVMDGNGTVQRGRLTEVHKKKCTFEVLEEKTADPKKFRIHLAIAPTKNTDRMEWMVEKLAEIGVDELTFITTAHSERRKLRIDRMEKKAISAMKQSGHPFRLNIHELTDLKDFIQGTRAIEKWIAHVSPEHEYLGNVARPEQSVTLLIGPEGDFHHEEIELATTYGFEPVSLGHSTLRTETAGLLACHFINIANES